MHCAVPELGERGRLAAHPARSDLARAVHDARRPALLLEAAARAPSGRGLLARQSRSDRASRSALLSLSSFLLPPSSLWFRSLQTLLIHIHSPLSTLHTLLASGCSGSEATGGGGLTEENCFEGLLDIMLKSKIAQPRRTYLLFKTVVLLCSQYSYYFLKLINRNLLVSLTMPSRSVSCIIPIRVGLLTRAAWTRGL